MTNTMTLTTTMLPGGVQIQTPNVDLTQKAIRLLISFGRFGNTKQINMSQVDVKDAKGQIDTKVKKSRLRTNKKLLDSPELEAIEAFDRQVKKYVNSLSLPYGTGEVMVSFFMVEEIDKQLKAFAIKRDAELVPAFKAKYLQRCEEASKDLGSVHRPQDYAPVDEVAKEFSFYWKWISTFDVPTQLAEISPTLWKEAKEKAAKEMEVATAEMQDVLRESMLELVDHMAEVLKTDPKTGKPMGFHATTVTNLTEFLNTFSFRNLTDDQALADVVETAKKMMTGVDVKRLKTKHSVRKQVQVGMEKLSAKLDTLLTTGTRKFRLEEEPCMVEQQPSKPNSYNVRSVADIETAFPIGTIE